MLSHRSQRVRVNNSFSSWQEVTSGISQGSVIGPLLFMIFINYLAEVIKSSKLFLFADDMKLFHAIYTEEDCTSLQQDLILAEQWTNTPLLKFHPNKCSHMRIGLSSIRNDGYTLGPEHITLTNTDKMKDIGVTFDSSLNFEEHVRKKYIPNLLMGIIRRTFDHMDEQCFSRIFKSLIRPHIEYANQIWSPHLKKHITSLENVKRRAIKLIPGFKDIEYKERLRKLKLPTLACCRLRGDMIELYKILT